MKGQPQGSRHKLGHTLWMSSTETYVILYREKDKEPSPLRAERAALAVCVFHLNVVLSPSHQAWPKVLKHQGALGAPSQPAQEPWPRHRIVEHMGLCTHSSLGSR